MSAADLARRARALKAEGRLDEALALYKQAASAAPASGVAQHNLASVLGDLRRFAESAGAARRAFALGLDAPETWLVAARAHMGLGALDAAERALREALRRRPDYADAHRDLAQLIWMCTADAAAALAPLDAAIAAAPDPVALILVKSKVLEFAGEVAAADALMAGLVTRAPALLPARLRAAHLAGLLGDTARALEHAEAAARLAPADRAARLALCTAQLGAGDAAAASALAAALIREGPHDQLAWALRATAWRLLGDARAEALLDLDRFVRAFALPTPPGWPDLAAYLADLRAALEALHGGLRSHPLEQSMRHGSQTPHNLHAVDDPAVRAFFAAVDAPIRAYLAGVGGGEGPLPSRNTGGYAMAGVWSVRLGAGGSHVDHVHPQGWISSAFYVEVPRAVEGPDRQGWIRFGRPPFPTTPPRGAQRCIRPEPGRLVLFPSYLWHGVVPFASDETRLTIAFDLVPGVVRNRAC